MAKGKYMDWQTEEGLTALASWARNGLTDEQIAHNIGITTKTLYEWKNVHSDIREVLKTNKEVADAQVENALFKSACGFTGPDGKYYPPSNTAQIFWLKNRQQEKWRDRQEVDFSGAALEEHNESMNNL